jgi:uncharacterized protein (DUF924 family)
MTTPDNVVAFWRDAGYERWFAGGAEFDRACESQCLTLHFQAARREFEHWLDTADGALALVLLLDQIPRNVFRGSAHSYATDPLARHYTTRALEAGFDHQVDPALRIFFYMPFEHSEQLEDQDRAVLLTATLDAGYARYAHAHHDVITRFGRFPHRNRALGRTNTPEEQAYLDAGGGFG